MRADLVEQLLDDEIAVCDLESLERRGVRLWREGTDVHLRFGRGRDGRPGQFRLDCSSFDAQPPAVSMVDLDSGSGLGLGLDQWTPGVPHSMHPTLNRPFVCIQGVLEYHLHPSHLDDSWDRYRRTVRIAQTVQRLLEKAGVTP